MEKTQIINTKKTSQTAGEATLESMNSAGWYNKWLLKKFRKYLKGDILEIGCGIGNFTKLLKKYGNVAAGDIEKKYIDLVQEKFGGGGVLVGKTDIERGNYFFGTRRFDSIVCLNVLEHIKDDDRALKNVYKLLKPKGYLILIVPSHPKLFGAIDKSIDHYRRYDKVRVKQWLGANDFKVVSIKRLNMLGGIGWYLSGKVFKDTKVSKPKIWLFNIIGPIYLFFERFFEPPLGTSILAIARKQ